MGRSRRSPLRCSLQLAYANGAIWGVGNGLASVSLIAYFARELHASGAAIAWILAAPSLVGLSRLLTPWWLHRVASRRRFCVGMFLASAAGLGLLPVAAAPGALGDSQHSLIALGSCGRSARRWSSSALSRSGRGLAILRRRRSAGGSSVGAKRGLRRGWSPADSRRRWRRGLGSDIAKRSASLNCCGSRMPPAHRSAPRWPRSRRCRWRA